MAHSMAARNDMRYKVTGKLGTGARFDKLEKTLAKKPGVKTPGALAAYTGRKKYGNSKFQKLAAKGRKG